jgi:hypothetical protein
MSFMLLDKEDLGRKLASIIRNAQHWVFVCDQVGLEHIGDLEEKYFSGERGRAFDAYFTPLGVAVFTAEKRCLSSAKLNDWLRNEGGGAVYGVNGNEAHKEKSDILFLAQRSNAQPCAQFFYDWVSPYYEEKSA